MNRILIADDEPSLRFLISETLKINNYEIFMAEDGDKALALALKEEPDLLILDVNMPGLTGLEVAQKYIEAGKKGIILILSAQDKVSDKEESFQKGSNYYMIKPFSPLDLLSLVEKIME